MAPIDKKFSGGRKGPQAVNRMLAVLTLGAVIVLAVLVQRGSRE